LRLHSAPLLLLLAAFSADGQPRHADALLTAPQRSGRPLEQRCGPAASTASRHSPHSPTADPATTSPLQAWLAGELILRAERLGLDELPPAIWHKTTAQRLILTGNHLSALPPEIGRLRDLRQLLLGGNRLSGLPDELCDLQQLERLELQDNRLEAVPRELARLVRLKLINLDGNPLSGRLADGGPTLLQIWLGPESIQGSGRDTGQLDVADGSLVGVQEAAVSSEGGDGSQPEAAPTGQRETGGGEAAAVVALSRRQRGKAAPVEPDTAAEATTAAAPPKSSARDRVGSTLSARRRKAAEAAERAEGLRRRTERLVRYLLALQVWCGRVCSLLGCKAPNRTEGVP